MTLAYWISFALLCAYLAIMIHSIRITRKRQYRQSLSRRLAAYEGGIVRAQPEPDTDADDLVSDWQRLRRMSPPHAQALVSKLERKHLLAAALLNLHENVHPFGAEEDDGRHLHSVKVG